MRYLIVATIITIIMPGHILASSLDGLWNFRANGTAVGFMDLKGNNGKLRLGSSREDTVHITQLNTTGSIGAKKIHIIRRGSYNHEFVGWVSYDGKQMAGYYIHNGQELPWSAVK